jgi:20S proteasome subunit alpha 5
LHIIVLRACFFSFILFSFLASVRLFQVEYAIEAVKLGSTAVGIQTTEGIILAVEKRLTSTLLEPSSVEKIMEVDFHIGAAVSGLIGGDFL